MRDDGLLLKQAAHQLGVSERTARRYQARMRRQWSEPQPTKGVAG